MVNSAADQSLAHGITHVIEQI